MDGLFSKRRELEPDVLNISQYYDHKKESIVEIFHDIQNLHGRLEPGIIDQVADLLEIPPHHAYGVATFYSMFSQQKRPENIIRICDGPVCWLNGSVELMAKAAGILKDNPEWALERSSCLGLCDRAPASLVNEYQVGPITLNDIPGLTREVNGKKPDYSSPRPGEIRVMLAEAGLIDPDSIQSALDNGAYKGLEKALTNSPKNVLSEIEESGLAGRGGAGFPVGRKWRFVNAETRQPKFIICNADESEPLHFKDRVLMDSNPHQLLEGMVIAGYATKANEGIIYVRGEYEPQAKLLENAVEQAVQKGYLGQNILSQDFTFNIHIHRGAGAYICGEETALIESLEGNRGEPRLRPPYPPQNGFLGCPTLVNNVESFAAVPSIISKGAAWYLSLSSDSTPGTKLYTLMGSINNPGLFEAPFGLTLREIIYEFGGGMRSGSEFKFALSGGAAGTIVPPSLLDIPIDYASSNKGVSLGAGGFLICDQTISTVEFLKEVIHFFKVESCGKCTPCRVGTQRSSEILQRLSNSIGKPGDIEELLSLADHMYYSSFCGLGQSIAAPIKSAINNFQQEFQNAKSS